MKTRAQHNRRNGLYTAGDIRPAPDNPRTITEAKLTALGHSMAEFGDLGGIVVNVRTGRLISGHQRLKHLDPSWPITKRPAKDACATVAVGSIKTPWGALSYREVDWTEKQERLANLAANQHGGEFDPDLLAGVLKGLDEQDRLLAGFDLQDVQALGIELDTGPAVDAPAQVDRAAELQKQWGTERGQLWQLGEHRLLCGDSTEPEDVARVTRGETPKLMVTDPPYGVSYDAEWRKAALPLTNPGNAGGMHGKVNNDDRADWSEAWRLFPGDVAYIWHAHRHASAIQHSLEAAGFVIRAQIIWAKHQSVIGRGHYHWQHEPCWYAVREGRQALWAGGHTQTTLWQIGKPLENETGHSTQKPLECMARPISNHNAPDVYEPFLGSGTTLIACENLARRCRAIEIDPGYVAVALQRWADATGKSPVLIP